MDSVSFDEQEPVYRVAPTTRSGGITGLAIKWGLAKDARGAAIALVVVAVLLLGLAVFVFLVTRPVNNPMSKEQLKQELIRMNAQIPPGL